MMKSRCWWWFGAAGLLALLLAAAQPAAAQNYVGDDDACAFCHASGLPGIPQVPFDAFQDSGHPWKLYRTAGQEPAPDTWPHSPVPPLPTIHTGTADEYQLQWSDVEFVIGNFFWKARFVDRDGYIWTGDAQDATQWNLATQEWAPYHAGEVRAYNCGRCHTTGYSPEGNQYDLPGVVGTWVQEGIHCEACHGPREGHPITPAGPGKTCSDCHYRDADFRMPWKSGFEQHHQQAEDLSHSPHRIFADPNSPTPDKDGCTTCHNPHRSTVYEDGGVTIECTDCHDQQIAIDEMSWMECTDCHMAKMAKSAVAVNQYTGDVHSHLFRIMTDPIAAADNVTEDGFWKQNENGDAFITLDYACLGCHQDDDLAWAAEHAAEIHAVAAPEGNTWLVKLGLLQSQSFTVNFEPFGGYQLVQTTWEDGSTTYGVGIELGQYLLWMNSTGEIYYGWRNSEVTMQGIVLGGPNGTDMWFAERQ